MSLAVEYRYSSLKLDHFAPTVDTVKYMHLERMSDLPSPGDILLDDNGKEYVVQSRTFYGPGATIDTVTVKLTHFEKENRW